MRRRGREGKQNRPYRPPPVEPGIPGIGYPLAFRLRVVEAVLSGKSSMAEVSRMLGPSVGTIQNWLVLYEGGGA